MNRRKINLHIERLVLTGMPEMQHQEIKTAVIQELTRLISQGKLSDGLNHSQSIQQVDGGTVEASSTISPSVLGSQLATQIYKGTFR